jgi:hypothetical protein
MRADRPIKHVSALSDDERRELMRFNFTGGPLDDPDGMDIQFAAFGLAAMAWARLETHLDALLIQINKKSFSHDIFDPVHPISFSRKLDLLNKWFRRHGALSGLHPAVEKLSSQLKTLSKDRNQFLHALFSAYSLDSGEITLRSIYYTGKESFELRRQTFRAERLVHFAMTVNSANESLWSISSSLFTPRGVELLRKL